MNKIFTKSVKVAVVAGALAVSLTGCCMFGSKDCCCKTIRSVAHLDIQFAHRFYGFKVEAQYLYGHTGGLTLENRSLR